MNIKIPGIIVLVLLLTASCVKNNNNKSEEVNKIKLTFNKEQTFKIVQFTDIHYKSTSARKQENIDIMNHVIKSENPDFVVLTGDIVIDPVEQGWKEITKPLIDAKVPWTVTFGNHDGETKIKKDVIFSWLKEMPFFIGEKGTVTGVNNSAIPIYSNDGTKVGFVLYLFDSNEYQSTPKYSKYDWIKFDQIAWYRQTSDSLKAANNNQPIPALAFFHIPIPEFSLINEQNKEKTRFTGQQFESVKPSRVNSGIFASFIEKNDVVGVFAGHDHENSYIGQLGDICLSYGQVSGVEAVDTSITRGARVIQIYENKFALESWVRTPDMNEKQYHFFYPAYLSDKGKPPHPAVDAANLLPGLRYKYYEGEMGSCADISKLKIKKEGIVKGISIDMAGADDHFGFEFDGFINIPETDIYNFYTSSDDGSMLLIDGELVVNNDGSHSKQMEEGSIALEKGYHKFSLLYFDDYMGNSIEIGFSTLNQREMQNQDQLFYYQELTLDSK